MPTIAQLQQAVTIAEKIQSLQAELASLIGGGYSTGSASNAPPRKGPGKRTMSAAARARIAAAQRARWAKAKGTAAAPAKSTAAKPGKKKRKLSAEGRARIVAALKKRWAAKKKAEK